MWTRSQPDYSRASQPTSDKELLFKNIFSHRFLFFCFFNYAFVCSLSSGLRNSTYSFTDRKESFNRKPWSFSPRCRSSLRRRTCGASNEVFLRQVRPVLLPSAAWLMGWRDWVTSLLVSTTPMRSMFYIFFKDVTTSFSLSSLFLITGTMTRTAEEDEWFFSEIIFPAHAHAFLKTLNQSCVLAKEAVNMKEK